MTASASDTASESDTVSDTEGDSDEDTGSEESGDTAMWCEDADGDGFGNPLNCAAAPETGDWVPNDRDCDDTHARTYPGAAEIEDATACMRDDDEDGWGSDDPPEDVMVGSDCDDTDSFAFPGAALHEGKDVCASDRDDDGWGDADPPGDATPGGDCFPLDASLNPDTLALATITNALLGLDDAVARVDPSTAGLDLMAPLDELLDGFIGSASVVEPGGRVLVNDASMGRLYDLEYELVCLGTLATGDVDPLPEAHGLEELCGLARDPGGDLVGIDAATDTVVVLSSQTGAVLESHPLALDENPLDIDACGMTFDCGRSEFIFSDGASGNIYSVDAGSGIVSLLAATGLEWSVGGLAYDPIARVAQLAADGSLYDVALDGSDDADWVGYLDYGLLSGTVHTSTLEHLPRCNP